MSSARTTTGLRQRYLLGWAALLLIMLPMVASAVSSERAGRVIVTTGKVEALAADGSSRQLTRRDTVFSGDTLRTGNAARAQVRFTDGALVSLRSDTELKIDDYHFEDRDAVDHKYLRLQRGGFRTVTGRIGRTNRAAYRVSTPLAVIGVRGTDWEALQQDNGVLLLGVNQGGITAKPISGNGPAADIGIGAAFNYAQINTDGTIQLLPEAPDALVKAQAVEKGEKPAEKADEKSAADEEKPVDADAGPPPSPPPAGGGDSGEAGPEVASTDPSATPPTPSINPADEGAGTPPTTVPLSRVFTEAEETAIVAETRLALVTGVVLNAAGPTLATTGLVGPSVDDVTPSFNFALAPGALPANPTRAQILAASTRFVFRGGVALSGQQDNVGGITGLTFARYDATAASPLRVFTDANNATLSLDLTSPYVFALFNAASVANLTGRLLYTPSTSNQIVVSSGTVSSVIGQLLLNLNLGSGQIERGVLDVGYGTTPDAFVFSADFVGNVDNGSLNATIANIILQDNVGKRTLTARGTVAGGLTGTAAIPGLALAFDYADTAAADQFARGVVLFNGQPAPPIPSLALSASEATQLQTGFFFVGTNAAPDGGAGVGRATDARLSLGSPILAFNENADGDAAEVTDANFLTFPPTILLRQSDAPTQGFRQTFTVAGTQSLSWGEWLGSAGAPVLRVDSATGATLARSFTTPLFWATALPKSLASLTGFTTFSGKSAIDFQGAFGASNGSLLNLLGVQASFAVDFGSGAISDGHLFAVTERSGTDDLGFEVNFIGNLVNSGGNAFARLTTTGGFYRGTGALDLPSTSVSGLFTGSGAQTSFLMSFFAVEPVPAVGSAEFATGTLAIGQQVEQRLSAADAAGINRIGITVFNPVDGQSNVITSLFHNLGAGLMVGRSSAVDAAAPDQFEVLANNGSSLADRGFFGGPADFVTRQGTAIPVNVSSTIGPLTGPFAVGWGAWQVNPASAQSATVQDVPGNAAANTPYVNRDVLFAAITPTPASLIGTAVYFGDVGGTPGLDLLAFGGPVNGSSVAFDQASMAVAVDFNSGLVNGDVLVGSTSLSTDFSAVFSGRLNRNVAQLTIDSLDVSVGAAAPVPGNIGASSMIGVVSGPAGEQFLTGFQFVGGGMHVEGFVRGDKQ